MSLIIRKEQKNMKPPLIADRRLYLDHAKERVVEEGSPEAAYLLAGKGGEIPADVVESLHLAADADGAVRQKDAPKAKPDRRIGKEREAEAAAKSDEAKAKVPAPKAPRVRKPKAEKPKE